MTTRPTILLARAKARAGIASFELVMSAPILMFLVAMLMTLYFATMKKSQLTMEVRHEAWRIRSNLSQVTGSSPFGLLNAHTSGEARKELSRTVETYRAWYPNVPRKIEWGNVVLAGSWDHRQVEFSPGGWKPIYPHVGILLNMVSSGGVSSNSGAVNSVGGLTSIPGL